MPKAYSVYQADIQSGFAIFAERTRKHPLMFIWFFILFLTAVWLIAAIITSSLSDPALVIGGFNVKWAYFSVFFIFFTLGALGTHFRLMRNPDLTLVLSSPISHRQVMLGKLMTTFWLNMGIYALGISSMLLVTWLSGMRQFIWLGLYVELTLLAMLGTIAGYLISVLGSVRPLARKGAFLLMGSMYLTSVWYALDLPYYPLCAMLLIMMGLASAEIYFSAAFFLEGWNAQTTVRAEYSRTEAQFFLGVLKRVPVSDGARAVAGKELLFNARTRENLGSVLTIFGIIAAEVGAIQTLGPRHDLKMQYARLVYPIVNAMAVYVGAILFCAVEGMTLLGKEAKSFWVVKSMPVRGSEVMKGKALSAFLSAIFLLAVAVPVPWLIYHNPLYVLFSVAGTLSLIFTYLGIGLWVGATVPNFTTSFRGTPDIITLYSTMMLCLVAGAVLLFPPLFLAITSKTVGMAAVAISVLIGALILLIGVRMAGRVYDRLEISM